MHAQGDSERRSKDNSNDHDLNSHTKFGFNRINHVRQVIVRKIETVSILARIELDATVMKNLYRLEPIIQHLSIKILNSIFFTNIINQCEGIL